jgi:hypothetical protein
VELVLWELVKFNFAAETSGVVFAVQFRLAVHSGEHLVMVQNYLENVRSSSTRVLLAQLAFSHWILRLVSWWSVACSLLIGPVPSR